jgi:hypothetical protein
MNAMDAREHATVLLPPGDRTHGLLPDSPTGPYRADGVLLRSTLRPEAPDPAAR